MTSAPDSTALARAVVTSLVSSGVRHVVLCPGSRSAALAYAVYDAAAAGALTLHVRHDERVAGFTALGLAVGADRPAAVLTTSGTAVANLHPAVLEAHHAGVPLLVLAADRPPRLRGTWANQTSDLQAGIFGAATRSTVDLTPEDGPAAWEVAVRKGVAAASGPWPGPVHLNLGFDEPLVPEADRAIWRSGLSHQRPQPHEDARVGPASGAGEQAPAGLGRAESGVVVVAGDRAGDRARVLAERLRVPLLAEPSSGARSGPNAVGPYRLLLDEPDLGGRIRQAIVIGRPTLSRPVTRLLARPEVTVVQVQDYPGQAGPGRADVVQVPAPALAFGGGLGSPPERDTEWLAAWQHAGSIAAQEIDAVIDGWSGLTGLAVAREVAAATGQGQALVAAASNPIRDLDLTARPWPGALRVHANRGLSGIDGTVATATGLALGAGVPTRVLVGDVAWLHDLGALVLAPGEPVPDLTVVVLNDGGGGIFSLLEQGVDAERDVAAAQRFERLFGTPHAVDVEATCRGLGVAYARSDDLAGLRLDLARRPDGLRVLEVPVARADLRRLHAEVARAVADRRRAAP